MAKYYCNGECFETSLTGLLIEGDTNEKNVFLLSPVDGNYEKVFEHDAKWKDPGRNKAIILYAKKNNYREVDCLAYVTWIKVDDPYNAEMDAELDNVDRAYLNGLLTQKIGKISDYGTEE